MRRRWGIPALIMQKPHAKSTYQYINTYILCYLRVIKKDKNDLLSYCVTPFPNKSSHFELICSFSHGLLGTINDASRSFLTGSLIGAANITFHVNACIGLLFKCLDGSDILLMFECSSHRISTFRFVSPI